MVGVRRRNRPVSPIVGVRVPTTAILTPRRGAAAGLAVAVLVAGCAPAVSVAPAPSASDPTCAVVLQFAPQVLDGLERRTTTSQASRAWGETNPVVLRCGVEPPGPSTDRCLRVEGSTGSVDWVAIEGETAWTFVTYGRDPAVEVTVPFAALGPGAQTTAVLVDLGPAVARTAVERTCL